MTTDKQIEVIEGNKLIAEFLEWTIEKGMEGEENPFYNQKYKPGIIPQMVLLSDFPFHTSWDWQIPAWSKVCHAVREIVLETITYKEWYFKMLDAYEQAVFSNNPKEGQEIIIEMIQWYNQSKPQTI